MHLPCGLRSKAPLFDAETINSWEPLKTLFVKVPLRVIRCRQLQANNYFYRRTALFFILWRVMYEIVFNQE